MKRRRKNKGAWTINNKIIRNSSLAIPKNINPRIYNSIKKHLTRNIKSYNNSTIKTVEFFVELKNYLHIPRYYPIVDMVGFRVVNEIEDGLDINISHSIETRGELQEKALDYMMSHDNGIINLDTGAGKTIVAIAAMSNIKKKTLILVHRSNLIEQWIERIEKFTNIKLGEDLSILKNTKIDESLQKSIVISTVQTLMSAIKTRKKEMIMGLRNAKFGLMVADEIHTTIGAVNFSKCSLFIPVKRVFGLSATPERRDGTSDILKYHLGDIYKPEGESNIMDARVTVILFNFGILPKSRVYVYWGGCFQRSRYLNLLKRSKLLINILMGLLEKFKLDRSVFIIAERITFIKELFKKFKYDDKNTFIEKNKNSNLESQIVFATPGKLRDGIDVPDKDCLILTSPVGNIKQMCGRILRKNDGKKTPIIIDLVDYGCKHISSTFYWRLKFYKNKNWNIQYISISDDKKIITEEDALKLVKPDEI